MPDYSWETCGVLIVSHRCYTVSLLVPFTHPKQMAKGGYCTNVKKRKI